MISVMTLNLRFGLAEDGPNGWLHRKRLFPELFSHLRPDIVGFQEANGFQAEDLQAVLSDYRYIGRRTPAPFFWQNNLIFYRRPWECAGSDHFFLSPTPDIPSRSRNSRWPRQCVIGLFRNGHRNLVVVNTHLDFSEDVQVESGRLILDRLQRFPAEDPAVILGDFNAEPLGACHRVFTDAQGPDAAFRDVFSPPYPGTYHGFSGVPDGRHIDWILYRGPLESAESRVLTEPVAAAYPSDHYPVLARLDWK